MRGVAQEHNAAFVPMPHGIAVGNRATPPEIHHGIECTHRWMGIAVYVFKLVAISSDIGFFSMGRG
ncbi:MAG: hypothetical protein WBD96_11735, partial [Pseudolabrys sp.]